MNINSDQWLKDHKVLRYNKNTLQGDLVYIARMWLKWWVSGKTSLKKDKKQFFQGKGSEKTVFTKTMR